MARSIKAFMFWVTPTDQQASGAKDAVLEYMKTAKPLEFDHLGQNYLAKEMQWNAQRSILTGTVYRIRNSGLPVAVKGTTTHDLPLDDDEALGEPMCFAYWPDPGGAVIHYAHTGPRHSVMPALLSKMGYPHPITVEPVLREDMLQQLQSKRYFRAVEFALRDPEGIAELRDKGGSIGHAIKALKDLGGVNVRVEVTMGHTKGEGLVANTAKTLARELAKLGAEAPDGHSPVSTIKVWGSEDEEVGVVELDLLRAREPITLTIDEHGRHLDRTDCQRKLSGALNERKDKFRLQAGQ
jgi:hypothetical protein